MNEEGRGKDDLGSHCAMVGSLVDQGVSIRLLDAVGRRASKRRGKSPEDE